MNEVLSNIVNLTLIPILPAVAVLLGLYIQKASAKLQEELQIAKDSKVALRMEEATQAVVDAVQYTTQTYVAAMKDKDAFDKQAQEAALKLSADKAVLLMSDAAKRTADDVSGDFDGWLKTMIESKIRELKPEPIVVDPVVDICQPEKFN